MKKIILLSILVLVLLIIGCATTPTGQVVRSLEPTESKAEQAVDEYLETIDEEGGMQEITGDVVMDTKTATQEEAAEEVEENVVVVTIKDGKFKPEKVIIAPNTTVVWVNRDNLPHKLVAHDRVFYGPRLLPGEKYNFTFTEEGTHEYFDAVFLKAGRGEIIVKK